MMDPEVQAALEAESSPIHTKVREFTRRRIEASDRRWSQRHDRWRESERLYRAFRVPDQQDQQTKTDRLTEGVEKIVVPYSYAVIQSILAFFMTVYTQRRPLVPVEGKGPSDVRAAILMEAILEHQWDSMEPTGTLILYQWLLDSLRYGIGIVKNIWTIREWPDLVRTTSPILDAQGQAIGYDDKLEERDVVSYEGNEMLNVSPFDWFPDPRRPFAEFQKGEFVVHRMRRSHTELVQREAEGLYAGIEHIPKTDQDLTFGTGSAYGNTGQSDNARTIDMDDADNGAIDEDGKPYVDAHEMWAYCNPRDLGLPSLSTGSTPRLWVFTIANLSRVIRAEAANLPGRRFPFECIELNYDVHSPANFGLIETFRGLQYHLSWLFNSRMMSVRRTLNNEMVVDPSIIEEIDLLDPEPGRLLRLKRAAWNSGLVDKAVFPLQVNDTTQGHMTDARTVTDLIETITGANRLIMGLPNTGRRAATEVQGQLNLSSGRMKLLTEIVSSQGLRPMAAQQARNTQAFLDATTLSLREPYAKLFGQPLVTITPDMLQGNFLFPFTEQGMPTDRMFEANMWKELLMSGFQSGAANNVLASMPWMQIFGRFLRCMGVKDLQAFGALTPATLTIQPDEVVQNQMQQGNLQGMSMDGSPRPPDGATPNIGANGQGDTQTSG